MMESIGQKAVLPTTDEVIVAGELDVYSGETGEERIFDTALEEIIAEHPLDESSHEEFLEEDDLNASLASAIFTQNQVDPEVAKENFGEIHYATIPSEIMKDNLWDEDSLSVQSQVLKKSTTVAQEMIEVLDPRVITEESNFQNLPVKGVAETGLQSFLQEPSQENQETLLQTVFHRVNPTEVDSDFTGDDLQTVLQKNTSLPVELEGDAEFSTDDLKTVLQKNNGQPVHIHERNSVVQDLKPIQENQEGLSQKEPQTVFPQGLQENAKETEKTIEENLVKIEPELLRPEEKLKAKESFQVADRIKIAEVLAASKAAKEIEGGVKIKTADVSQPTIKAAEGIEIGVKAGFQTTGVENSRDISGKETILPVENLKAAASQQIVDKIKMTEALESKAAKEIEGGVKIKTADVSQATFKAAEGIEAGVKAGFQTTGVSDSRDISEKATILPTEKLKVGESRQIVDRIKMTEVLESRAAKEIEGGVKIKTDDVSQATFKAAEGIEGGVKAGFQTTGVENSGDISEKVSTQPLNQFRKLASKETQLSSNAKSTTDFVSPQGINAVSELSGTSIIKPGEAVSNAAETVRGADLPFEMDQVVNRVRILRGNGVEEMTLRLHPEELGHITLKVRQSGGGLSIDMRVDNPLAKQMVESGFDSLRSRFLDQEFSYRDLALNVDINQRDSQYGGDREHFEFEEEMFSSEKGKKEEISSLEETPHVRHRTDSGFNLYV